jgi:hypothetical protein
LGGTPEARKLLGTYRHSLEDIKWSLNNWKGRAWNGFIWLHYRGKRRAFVDKVMNRGIPYKERNVLSGLGIIRFHRRTLLRGLISYLVS